MTPGQSDTGQRRWTDADEQLRYLAKEISWEPGQIDDPRIGDELRPVDLALNLIQEYGNKAATAERLAQSIDAAVEALCALAEEQVGNPHDPLSTRLYDIAHGLELRETDPNFEETRP